MTSEEFVGWLRGYAENIEAWPTMAEWERIMSQLNETNKPFTFKNKSLSGGLPIFPFTSANPVWPQNTISVVNVADPDIKIGSIKPNENSCDATVHL